MRNPGRWSLRQCGCEAKGQHELKSSDLGLRFLLQKQIFNRKQREAASLSLVNVRLVKKEQNFKRQNHSAVKIRACETTEMKGGFGVCVTGSANAVELTMVPPEGCGGPCTIFSLAGGLVPHAGPKLLEGDSHTQPIQGGWSVSH